MPGFSRISAPRKYKDREGNEKTAWDEVGVIRRAPEGKSYTAIINLHMFPGVSYFVFPDKDDKKSDTRSKNTPPSSSHEEAESTEYDDDIPF
jgi:hypothetical protein